MITNNMNSYLNHEAQTLLRNKEDFLKNKNLNPYKFLGVNKKSSDESVTKAYNKLLENPDICEEDLEYCYDYILFKNATSSFEDIDLKVDPRDSSKFENSTMRKKIFMTDEINFEPFLQNENKDIDKLVQEYRGNSIEILQVPGTDTFLSPKTKKFNVNKFNKMFEQHFDTGIHDELFQGMIDLNANCSIECMPIKSYDGIIVEDVSERNLDNVHLKKNLAKNNKTLKEPVFKDTMKAYSERKNQSVSVDTSKTFAEAEAELLEFKKKNMSMEKNKNREYINSIFK
jgi:hypothetical protein